MKENFAPETIVELEHWMTENCFNFNNYSINGNMIYESCGIEKIGNSFTWYYTERGEKRILHSSSQEKEIVAIAYQEIKSDKWANTHAVGFTSDETEIKELGNLLRAMNIEFFQDKIPYYSSGVPSYRIFVLGCDIHKVAHLKEKYYKLNSAT